MDDHGQVQPPSYSQLLSEDITLHLAWRVIIVIVKSDFAQRDYLLAALGQIEGELTGALRTNLEQEKWLQKCKNLIFLKIIYSHAP